MTSMGRRLPYSAVYFILSVAGLTAVTGGCTVGDNTEEPTQRQSSPLSSIQLDTLRLPSSPTRNLLCVTLSSNSPRQVEEVSIQTTDDSPETLHTFSNVDITRSGRQHCTVACPCLRSESPGLEVLIADGGRRRRLRATPPGTLECCDR